MVDLVFGSVVSRYPGGFVDQIVVCPYVCKSLSIFVHGAKSLLSHSQFESIFVISHMAFMLPWVTGGLFLFWSGVDVVAGCRNCPLVLYQYCWWVHSTVWFESWFFFFLAGLEFCSDDSWVGSTVRDVEQKLNLPRTIHRGLSGRVRDVTHTYKSYVFNPCLLSIV